MNRRKIKDGYFEWLVEIVNPTGYDGEHSYRKLLSYLHDVEFTFSIHRDISRARDGEDLRYRYAHHSKHNEYYEDVVDCLRGPCSVLEMLIALSLRCEEQIMCDPELGDRTSQWFWKMIMNLGLGHMTNPNFDLDEAESIISIFLDRAYEPDGRGGLFTVRNIDEDMRDMEIWRQMLRFLNTI